MLGEVKDKNKISYYWKYICRVYITVAAYCISYPFSNKALFTSLGSHYFQITIILESPITVMTGPFANPILSNK